MILSCHSIEYMVFLFS